MLLFIQFFHSTYWIIIHLFKCIVYMCRVNRGLARWLCLTWLYLHVWGQLTVDQGDCSHSHVSPSIKVTRVYSHGDKRGLRGKENYGRLRAGKLTELAKCSIKGEQHYNVWIQEENNYVLESTNGTYDYNSFLITGL